MVFNLSGVRKFNFSVAFDRGGSKLDETFLPTQKKKIMLGDNYRIHFPLRSNVGIMAANRDPVKQ